MDRISGHMARYRLDSDRPNPETSLERLMRVALDHFGLRYEEQARIGRYRPDFVITLRGRRIVVECDGPHHRTPQQQRKDRRKDAAYAAAGYAVVRFTGEQIRKSAIGCVQQIVNSYAS